jgi:hypothetical protein
MIQARFIYLLCTCETSVVLFIAFPLTNRLMMGLTEGTIVILYNPIHGTSAQNKYANVFGNKFTDANNDKYNNDFRKRLKNKCFTQIPVNSAVFLYYSFYMNLSRNSKSFSCMKK